MLGVKSSLVYLVEGTDQRVILRHAVVQHVRRHMQKRVKDPEKGGQLFARISPEEISIERATGPYKEDKSSRFLIVLDRQRQKADILSNFKSGLHYVGDWHTHPEPVPSPSSLDLEVVRDCFTKSRHELYSFLMLIVGSHRLPDGMWLSQHNEQIYRPLIYSGTVHESTE